MQWELGPLTLMRPLWLLGLPVLALLCWRTWRGAGAGVALWRDVVDSHLLPHLLVGSAAPRRTLGALAGAALIALLALAGPALDRAGPPALERAAVRVLVLDLSPRMTAARLERVRLKLLALLRALPDGQTALVVYAGEPYLVAPPTTDGATIALFVPDLAGEVVPVPGDRPQLALDMAHAVLARGPAGAQRDLLWIRAGGAAGEAPAATPAGVRLSVWQVDPDAPDTAAPAGGGALVPMRASDEDVEQLAALLNQGGQWNEAAHSPRRGGADIGYWLVPLLLPLAALTFRRGVLLALLIGPMSLGAGLLPRPAMALELPAPLAEYWAWRQMEAGRPAEAERFADPRWRAIAHYRAGRFELASSALEGRQDADSHYNRGNALAQQGRLADALAAYEAALLQLPADADYIHNRDLMRRLLNRGERGGRPPAPPPPSPPSGGQSGPAAQEAARVAEQWLRQVPDQPGTLLRRKLQLEQRRRQAGTAQRAW